MPAFTDCSFGPFPLRRALRSRLALGERLIAWGVVERAPEADFLRLGLRMAPIVGPLFEAFSAVGDKRFLVLTDSRVLVLHPRRRPGSPGSVVADAALAEVTVRAVGAKTFEIALDDGDPPQRLKISEQRSRAAGRLREALAALGADGGPGQPSALDGLVDL